MLLVCKMCISWNSDLKKIISNLKLLNVLEYSEFDLVQVKIGMHDCVQTQARGILEGV